MISYAFPRIFNDLYPFNRSKTFRFNDLPRLPDEPRFFLDFCSVGRIKPARGSFQKVGPAANGTPIRGSNRVSFTDGFHHCSNCVAGSRKLVVRHVSGCHGMPRRSRDSRCSRIRRFPCRSMSPKRGLPSLCNGGIANRPFSSDRNRVARSSVDRMDFVEQMQNVFSAVGRLTYQQAMRSHIEIAATMNGNEPWITITRVSLHLCILTSTVARIRLGIQRKSRC